MVRYHKQIKCSSAHIDHTQYLKQRDDAFSFHTECTMYTNSMRNVFYNRTYEQNSYIYPTKKETHTVVFSNFLEKNNKFSYFIYTIR